MLRSAEVVTTARLHEETFLARYERLLGWALQLTSGDREQAEDLVHDAYIQFTLSSPDLAGIRNLDGYLYTMLRNLRLSQIRRRQRLAGRPLSALQYDSAELSLRAVDPRDQIRVQDELRQICRYACIRKETSKAGGVLLLRFMLGYYPREIAQVMRASKQAAEERLRVARGEARLFLESPGNLNFIRGHDVVSVGPEGYARPTDELLHDLRRAVFASCRGDCLTAARLAELYRGADDSPVGVETLAHVVSCPRCLDAVNRLLGLPPLAERYPTDTMGTDSRPKGGGGGGATADGEEQIARRCRRRARETFEHRPQELRVSVNGYVMASQRIGSRESEQELSVTADERIDFVEVFSEQEVRLLFLCVDEMPPAGPHSRSVKVDLSDARSLEATLNFSSPWPTVRIAYSDPELEAAASQQYATVIDSQAEPSHDATIGAAEAVAAAAAGRRPSWRGLAGALGGRLRGLARPSFWLRPGVLTAAVSLVLAVAALLYVRLHEPAVSAARLLERSAAAEKAAAADTGLVLHRTISLEVQRPGAEAPRRNRIEVWQSAARGQKVRRLYDERGTLLAGVWEDYGSAPTVYRRGAQARKEPDTAPDSLLSEDDAWRIDLSSEGFSALIGDAAHLSAEEGADGYVLEYAGLPRASARRLAHAALVLSKGDLRATSQTLVVDGAGGRHEYRFVETSFSKREAGRVDPAVFRPEPELSGRMEDAGARAAETITPGFVADQPAGVAAGTPPAVASAELEIEVNYLLDQIKANLGEQVSVGRTTGGKLRVEALVETERRKEEILRALGPVINNPAVVAEVLTVEEAVRRQKGKAAGERGEDVQEVEVETRRIPADDELRRHFSSRLTGDARIEEEIERFAQRQMSRSRQALMHANALKRLAARFSTEEVRSLAPEARAKWQTMIRQHARGYREQLAAMRRELRPVFAPGADTEGGGEGGGDETLRRDAERLLRLSYAHDEAVRAAFTLSDSARAAVALKSPQFWRSLAAAESLAEAIESAHRERRE